MQIRVLGCSGAIAAGSRTTSFLLDDDVLIDAGSGVGDLTLDEMVRVDHILVTHAHLDHVLAIGLLADSVNRRRRAAGRPAVVVHALQSTLDALRAHIFNGVIWPDFTRLPDAQHPALQLQPLVEAEVLELGGRRIEVLPALHTVPAVGYAVHGPGGAWVFTGDTGPNAALWQRLRLMAVAMLVIETAFADDESDLAAISCHHCPATLGRELAQLPGSAEVFITHIKPGDLAAVMAGVAALATSHRIRALHAGQLMRWPAAAPALPSTSGNT